MSLKPPIQDGDDLDLTIRFSASIPDLLLTIPSHIHANTSTLKQRIRENLPPEHTDRRLRLIYAGKALTDNVPLNKSLKRPVSRPPSRVATPGPYDDAAALSAKAKGKLAVRDPPVQSRIYIHCSIGDLVLSSTELAAEAALAGKEDGREDAEGQSMQDNAMSTAPAPRGFDRLLSAGFSTSEVQSLRLQFLAIQAHTHTPDAMPSPNTLRDMEDQWLDNSNAGGNEAGGAGGRLADDDGQAGALDDMIWGTAMGFFWPIGCLMWALREEGIFTERRKMAVAMGFVLNVGLGLVKLSR